MLFQGGSFFVHEGMPYCEIHYHAKRGSLCAGCHKPITGNVIFSFLFFFLKKEISYTPNTRAGKQQQQQEQAFNLIFLLYLNLPFLYYNTIIITRHTMWMNLLFVYCSVTPGDREMAILLVSVLKVVEAQVSEGSACQAGCN